MSRSRAPSSSRARDRPRGVGALPTVTTDARGVVRGIGQLHYAQHVADLDVAQRLIGRASGPAVGFARGETSGGHGRHVRPHPLRPPRDRRGSAASSSGWTRSSFVPTGQPWMKEHEVVSPAEDRYLMTVIATAATRVPRLADGGRSRRSDVHRRHLRGLKEIYGPTSTCSSSRAPTRSWRSSHGRTTRSCSSSRTSSRRPGPDTTSRRSRRKARTRPEITS